MPKPFRHVLKPNPNGQPIKFRCATCENMFDEVAGGTCPRCGDFWDLIGEKTTVSAEGLILWVSVGPSVDLRGQRQTM